LIAQAFTPTVVFVLLALLAGAIAWLFLINMQSKQQLAQLSSALKALQGASQDAARAISDLSHQLEEERAKSVVMAKQVAGYQAHLDQLGNKQRELEQQDPNTRLYQKAVQLAKDGASIDELVQACDLPQAEAQLLVNLHQNN